jgi:putative hydrolase of HD superfamily
MMAVVLAEHAPEGTDVTRAIRMALVHDLVEIDAGDTFAFDVAGHSDKADREAAAARRLFALLPPDDGERLRALWDEFEAGASADAQFAVALDRFSGLLQNWAAGDGGTWRKHAVPRAAVLDRMEPIRLGAPELWPFVIDVIDAAAASGFLGPGDARR